MKAKYSAFFLSGLCVVVAILAIQAPTPGTAWSLAPPLFAITLALMTGHLLLSLGFAVWLGAFLFSYGDSLSLGQGLWGSLQFSAQSMWLGISHLDNLLILGFVIVVLNMVQIMSQNGSLQGLVLSLEKRVSGPRSAQLVTALLGCVIFIDDYANTMVVGSTMKSVTDRYGISREKLAFLVDATSAPIAGVALVSTWVGFEVGLFNEMSTVFSWGVDGYGVFLQGLSFRFYCWMMLLFVFVQIFFAVDYGPMVDAKPLIVAKTHKPMNIESLPGGPWPALLPLLLLFISVFSLLWWDGGGWERSLPLFSPSAWQQVLTQSQNGIAMLFYGALISGIFTVLLSLTYLKMPVADLFQSLGTGVKKALLPVVILLLAWTLKSVTDHMLTGSYLVGSLGDGINPIWLPMLIFLLSMFVAFATGTSWGTMAILIPTVTPLAVSLGGGEYSLYVALCLAAILDGAIMGDHCSPISDTTLMSAIATECDVLSHVRTQWPYSVTVGLLAWLLGYLPAGWFMATGHMAAWPLSLSLFLALLLLVALFFALKRRKFHRE